MGSASPTTGSATGSTYSAYLIRLTQSHSSFRRPELEALAIKAGVGLSFLSYDDNSPYCIVRISPKPPSDTTLVNDHDAVRSIVAQSILAKGVYELYAVAPTYEELHSQVRGLPAEIWQPFKHVSFKFLVDAFCGKRSIPEQREIIEGFGYLPLKGSISLKNPEEEFVVFEEWDLLTPEQHAALNIGTGFRVAQSLCNAENIAEQDATAGDIAAAALISDRKPKRIFFTRYIGPSQRNLIVKHDLKKRPYISTTSMDAELALITASLALAAPGKLFLDPFTGTGGFMIAAAELGAVVLGSDIDGRSFRGKGTGLTKGIGANLKRYKLTDRFGDCLTSDLTNTPFRLRGLDSSKSSRWLDGIICDPPYGIREGLKVLGRRLQDPDEVKADGRVIHEGPYYVDGVASHTLPDFIAPKRPYSFDAMLSDILDFATRTLVDCGRLAFWMPVANDSDEEFPVPIHPMLEIRHSCIQVFNKWSRRLLVYERIPGEVSDDLAEQIKGLKVSQAAGRKADELNQFRRMYFRGFHVEADSAVEKAGHSPEVQHG
ncbi:hypothetical protein LTR64_007127 [Lithohypha guttulata]|uniref:uncharacterized protein n=1 Tax=Lithohypha guttulata TaxID=1690604 RepID=UPI002DE0DBA7|nr:hypothetical protein LTR51_004317 [Lithohypha guttulata]